MSDISSLSSSSRPEDKYRHHPWPRIQYLTVKIRLTLRCSNTAYSTSFLNIWSKLTPCKLCKLFCLLYTVNTFIKSYWMTILKVLTPSPGHIAKLHQRCCSNLEAEFVASHQPSSHFVATSESSTVSKTATVSPTETSAAPEATTPVTTKTTPASTICTKLQIINHKLGHL